ncbi:methyltransferase domain-containing protein [Catellatospora sp. KI3]|uniref:methyltransferase domain-containing protein n=1 Tax=Catellatospora sp. KI3 TaxID=3041620 RepID=UPI00248324A4|nr:methyltransferase domain-containing protein [Catellatospora sp. KI3]MDI1464711.1 methyltransferase domain-containing protein [Catellatospora sp. KI3]
MSDVTRDVFDDKVTAWRQWQDAPWGRLRYTLAEHNIARHLDGRRLRILDVAGGNGVEAVRYAAAGHQVTLVDYAPQMLASARSLAESTGVGNRVTVIESDVAKLVDVVEAGSYDLVLCHNLLPYVADVESTLASVLAPLRPGGLASIIAANAHSEPLRIAIRDMDLTAAYESLDATERYTQTFSTPVYPRTADDVSAALRRLGSGVLGHYGIRSVCDFIPDDERKYDASFFAELERLELALTDRMPFLLTARLFHLIASAPVE